MTRAVVGRSLAAAVTELLAVAAIALAALVVSAPPASAHTVSGQGATNYRTELIGVSPGVPGLTVKVVEGGLLMQITWTGSANLTVLGYQGEPYLRIGPGGVYRNRLSPATYLNVTRLYGTVPPFADAAAPPEWVKLSSGRTVRYHDHRIHWMGGPTPPEVTRAPHAFHHVFVWTVTMTESGQQVHVTGDLDWVPGSSPWPWVGMILVLGAAGAIVGASRRWARGLLAFLALLVVVDVFHAVGTGLFVIGSVAHKLVFMFTGSYYSAVAWALGGVSARLLSRRSVDGLFAAIFTALVIGLFGGLADIVALARSQVPFIWGITTDKVIIAASAGLGAGLLVGSLIAFRANRPAPVFEDEQPPVVASPDA